MSASWYFPAPLTEPAVIFAADLLRAGVIFGSGLVVCVSLALSCHQMTRWQRCRFLSYVPLFLFVGGTEVGQLHRDVIFWRLPAALVGLALAGYGVWGLRAGRDRIADHSLRRDRRASDR